MKPKQKYMHGGKWCGRVWCFTAEKKCGWFRQRRIAAVIIALSDMRLNVLKRLKKQRSIGRDDLQQLHEFLGVVESERNGLERVGARSVIIELDETVRRVNQLIKRKSRIA